MSAKWWDTSWNPVTGCTPISAGCDHCYAKVMASRMKAMGQKRYQGDDPFSVRVHDDKMDEPLKWKKPRRVFVNSMGDLFHRDIGSDVLEKITLAMFIAEQHTFLICTKRAEWMSECFVEPHGVLSRMDELPWPLPNVHLGVTVEREDYEHRIITLLHTPAAVRWLSMEPLLGPIDLHCVTWTNADCETPRSKYGSTHTTGVLIEGYSGDTLCNPIIDWVVVGCESGPNARPCKTEWVEAIVEQCSNAGVPVWVKQLNIGGQVTSDLAKFPEHLRLRQLPGGES